MFKKFRIWLRYIWLISSRKAVKWYEKATLTEHFFMIIMAIIIGIIGGLGAVFVRWLIEELSLIFFSGEGSTHERISNTHWLLILFIPTIGGLLVGLISKVNIPDAKGHGVPEVIYSLNKKGGKISPLVALFKSITSSFTISSGGSVGSEGPMVQIGASIGSTVGQFFKVNSLRMRILVGCGVASGIAAAFNVPIAGALFAIEIILFDFAIVSFTPILISAGIATIITHYFVGDFTEFIVPPLMIVSPYEVISYFVLGALCGIVSFIFIKVLYTAEEFFEKKININQVLKPALGGLIIGFVGIYFPHTMGVGNDSINSAINNDIIWYIALILVFLKILTTSITLGSGGSGGVIAPALFIGAMLGSFYGNIINFYFPNVTAESSAYALVAMGGLIAGIIRAPLTSIIIIFELSKQTTAIIPLMLVSTISLILSQKLSRESIYTLKLLKRNLFLNKTQDINLLSHFTVEDLYKKNFLSIPENTNFTDIVSLFIKNNINSVSVYQLNTNKFMGYISINSIKEIMFDKEIVNNVIIAGDIVNSNIKRLELNIKISEIYSYFRNSELDKLPVFENLNSEIQIGEIYLDDINELFHQEMYLKDTTSNIRDKLYNLNKNSDVRIIEGHSLAEIPVPDKFVGRTIKGLKIRNQYNVEIITIKTKKDELYEQIIPSPDYEFKKDDTIIVMGEEENVNILKNAI